MYFFPRHPDRPLVSILIPTRGRPAHLRQAIDSVHSLARNKTHLEYVFRCDTDDTETIATVDWLCSILPCKKIVKPRGNGYHDMHHMVNDMATIAEGDWLFLFNDDARFKMQDWDQLLLTIGTRSPWIGIGDVCMIIAPTEGRPFAQEFFFVRKRTVDILGHVSLSPHCDNYLYSIMKFIGCSVDLSPISIEHLSHLIGDKIREESVEAYKSTTDTLNLIEAKVNRLDDAGQLLRYLRLLEKRIPWQPLPERPGNYFRKPPFGLLEVCKVDNNLKAIRLVADKEGKDMTEPVEVAGSRWAPLEICVGG